MTINSTIQWNNQSHKAKYYEPKILLRKYSPACICLLGTLISNNIHDKIIRDASMHSEQLRIKLLGWNIIDC